MLISESFHLKNLIMLNSSKSELRPTVKPSNLSVIVFLCVRIIVVGRWAASVVIIVIPVLVVISRGKRFIRVRRLAPRS